MVAFTYSRVIAANYNTTPPTVAKSATGSVYAIADTTFTTPLNLTLVVGGVTTTSISADSSGIFPDFTVNDRTSVVWKQTGSPFSTVLTTTDPVPGPQGTPGPPGTPGGKGDRGDLAAWQPTTFYPLNQVISNPLGDLVKVTTAHTSTLSYDSSKFDYVVPPSLTPTALSNTIDAQLDAAGIKGADDGSGATAIYKNAADKVAYTIGNAPGSAGFPGTGSPAKALGALALYMNFGTPGGSNTPVPNTTQTAYLIANYHGPTADDSAEAFSTFVGVKNTGVPFTQTKPVTGFESIAQVESGNTVSGSGAYALGVGSRVNVLGTGHIENAYGFKASVNTSGGTVFGTIGKYVAFAQLVTSGATDAYGVYVADKINSETSVSIGKSAYSGSLTAKLTGNGDSSNSMLLINLPTAADAPGTLTGIRIVAPTGQTKPLQEWYGAGSGTAGSRIDSGGNFSARTSINLTDSTFSNNLMRLDSTGLTLTTGMNLILSTGSGTKIGTNVSQKLGFWNAAPVIQQPRPTDLAGVISLLALLGLSA